MVRKCSGSRLLRRMRSRWRGAPATRARSSVAVRLGDEVPILVDEAVFDEAGVLFEEEQDEDEIEEFRAFLDEIKPEDFA